MSGTHSVGEVARLARITIRTLHHYDQIGLLTPTATTTPSITCDASTSYCSTDAPGSTAWSEPWNRR